jgi:hypothetical protein
MQELAEIKLKETLVRSVKQLDKIKRLFSTTT